MISLEIQIATDILTTMIERTITAKPARLSREAAQHQTRERLLEAAEQLFVRDGFNGTSLRDIAAHAGYSQGAFYSNFRDKGEVLLELMGRHKAEETARATSMIASLSGTADDILAALEAWASSLDETTTWCTLSVELQLQAARDPAFAVHYEALWHTQRNGVAEIVRILFEKLGRVPPASFADVAANFMALIHGIALQRISASATASPAQTTSAPIMLFLRGLLAQSEPTSSARRDVKRSLKS